MTLARALRRAAFLIVGAVSSLTGQEDSITPAPVQETASRCDLSYKSRSPDTESFHVEEPTGGYTTYIRRGMIWQCGTATMAADSAVRFESGGWMELVHNVDYRDTIRTLRSDRLLYRQAEDQIDALGNVHLTRLSSGSTLTGPRVQFLRAVSGVDEITRAEGRPHMTLYPQGQRDAPPFEVDANRAVFAGEEEARAIGNVTIHRPDMDAAADSAYFDLENGGGVLYGSPWVQGEAFRLEADTIHLLFEEGELREVRALGTGTATGEDFEVLAERITVQVEEDEVTAVWAHGPGRALAISSSYRMYGDSLRFLMFEGAIDTVVAIGEASAVQTTDEPATESESPRTDTTDGTEGEVTEGEAEGPPVLEGEVGDSTTQEAAEVAGADQQEDGQEAESEPGESSRVPAPELTTTDRATWVQGDTLVVAFARLDSAVAESPDSAASSQIEWMRAIGNARSYYTTVRDTAESSRPSRNYVLGRALEIIFEEGEPRRVSGENAIGVYLEPGEVGEPGVSAADTVSADSTRADSVPSDSVRADSTRTDSTRADSVPSESVWEDRR